MILLEIVIHVVKFLINSILIISFLGNSKKNSDDRKYLKIQEHFEIYHFF